MDQERRLAHWEVFNSLVGNATSGRQSVATYAERFGYPEFALALANGDQGAARDLDPIQYDRLSSQVAQRDNRDILTYARDVITGWVVEDICILWLRQCGLDVRKNGVDSARTFAWARDITNKADFILCMNGREYPIELAATYDDSWTKYNSVWLRANKKDHIFQQGAMLLGCDIFRGKFVTISPWQEGLRYDTLYRFGKEGSRIFWPYGQSGYQYETSNKSVVKEAIMAYTRQYDLAFPA